MHVPCYYVCIYVCIKQIKDLNLHGARNVRYPGICNRLFVCAFFINYLG